MVGAVEHVRNLKAIKAIVNHCCDDNAHEITSQCKKVYKSVVIISSYAYSKPILIGGGGGGAPCCA